MPFNQPEIKPSEQNGYSLGCLPLQWGVVAINLQRKPIGDDGAYLLISGK